MNKKTHANNNQSTIGMILGMRNSSSFLLENNTKADSDSDKGTCENKRLLQSSLSIGTKTLWAPKGRSKGGFDLFLNTRPYSGHLSVVNMTSGSNGMFLQKSPFQLLGLSHCQNAMMIWLYCHHAQNVNPQSGVALIDQSGSLTLNALIGRVLKQSYVANYQNQLTFALSKTKPGGFGETKPHHSTVAHVELQSFTIANMLIQNQHAVRANQELVLHKGTEFYSANWILYNLQQKLQARNSNIKRAMQELFDRAALLLDQKVLKGLTIKMSGRLSGRKQGMAKTVSKTIGVLPLSGLKQTVDYDQGFVTTKLGCLGIKVWVFY